MATLQCPCGQTVEVPKKTKTLRCGGCKAIIEIRETPPETLNLPGIAIVSMIVAVTTAGFTYLLVSRHPPPAPDTLMQHRIKTDKVLPWETFLDWQRKNPPYTRKVQISNSRGMQSVIESLVEMTEGKMNTKDCYYKAKTLVNLKEITEEEFGPVLDILAWWDEAAKKEKKLPPMTKEQIRARLRQKPIMVYPKIPE